MYKSFEKWALKSMVYRKQISPPAKDFICFILSFLFAYICGCYLMFLIQNKNPIVCAPPFNERELENDDFLFLAVQTSNYKFSSKAKTILNTWGSQVPGKLLFLVDGLENYNGSLPIVGLDDINGGTSSAVKTLFSILRYVTNEYGTLYQWFMITNDNVFVNIKSLEKFLRSIDGHKRPQYIGKSVKGDYCLKDNGIILSRSTLLGIKHHLKQCLGHSVTHYDDLELGQCIQRYVGISCSWAIEFDELFVRVPNARQVYPGWVTENTLTIQPTQHLLMYQWFNYFSMIRSGTNRITADDLNEEVSIFSKLIDQQKQDKEGIINVEANIWNLKKELAMEMLDKDQDEFSLGVINDPQEHEVMKLQSWDIVSQGIALYKTMANLKAKRFILKEANMSNCVLSSSKYQRSSRGNLMENIFIKKCHRRTQILRTVQSYTSPEIQIPEADMSKTIWMILPLFKKVQAFTNFLNMLANSVSKFNGRVNLRVVLHVDAGGDWNTSKALSNKMKHRINIDVITVDTIFSRSSAKTTGTRGLPSTALLLFVDVDMGFDENFLKRTVVNTIYKKQVYFPICFSQYDPFLVCYNDKHCNFSVTKRENKFGFWRNFGFGMVGIYKGDFTRVGGFDLKIKTWGMEDVNLYDRCLYNRHRLNIMRSIDPSLVHRYHGKVCTTSLSKKLYAMCLGAKVSGNEQTLYNILSNFTK